MLVEYKTGSVLKLGMVTFDPKVGKTPRTRQIDTYHFADQALARNIGNKICCNPKPC